MNRIQICNMEINSLNAQLADIEERYQKWVAPINQVILSALFRVNRDGYTSADCDRDVDEIRKKQLTLYDPNTEMYAVFDELTGLYLEVGSEDREHIRITVSDKDGLLSALVGYANRSANHIKSLADRIWLKKGLAALSIEDCCKDFRDVLLALSELYLAAEDVGLYPMPEFKAIARLSSHLKPFGGDIPMSRLMGGIQRFAVLEECRRSRQKKD